MAEQPQMSYQQLLQAERYRAVSGESLLAATESDRARVVQSAPVRRLQQKTQVFPLDVKASVRSRLTHSLEVQQAGREVMLALLPRLGAELPQVPLLNLMEMACLLHDVGNPPFGHFGESVLRDWLANYLPALYGRSLQRPPSAQWQNLLLPDLLAFDGNAQSLRLVHSLQRLNLTFSLLASLIKVPMGVMEVAAGQGAMPTKVGYFFSERQLVAAVRQTLGLPAGARFPLVYVMEAADDLCYCIADLEDAVDRGLLTLEQLQAHLLAQWRGEEYLAGLLALGNQSEEGFFPAFRRQLSRDLVQVLADAYQQQEPKILAGQFASPLLADQHPAVETLSLLRRLAREQIFTRREVEALELEGYAALWGVLERYARLLALPRLDFSELLAGRGLGRHPFESRLCHRLSRRHIDAYQQALQQDEAGFERADEHEWYYRVRLLIDYISGMTDTYVLEEYRLLSGI